MVDVNEMACRRITAEFHGLRVPFETKDAVVQNDNDYGKPHAHDGFELGPTMGETAIANESNDRALRTSSLGTDRKRHTPTKPGEATRRDKAHDARCT
ncbi:hypothetical protein D9M72_607530 [compost metagenome]